MLQLSFREDVTLTLRFSLSRSVVTIDAVYVPFAYTLPKAIRVLVKASQATCLFSFYCLGFIPVVYSAIYAKYHQKSVQLPEEEEETAPFTVDGKVTQRPKPMAGWSILLMWIPAVCDLTGTTVCN